MTGADETFAIAFEAAQAFGRPPTSFSYVDGRSVVSWDPPLTAQQQATYDAIALKYRAVRIEPEEWAAIRDDIVVIRDLRQLGRNAFMALTAADRDRALYDAQAATTTILLALLRE